MLVVGLVCCVQEVGMVLIAILLNELGQVVHPNPKLLPFFPPLSCYLFACEIE